MHRICNCLPEKKKRTKEGFPSGAEKRHANRQHTSIGAALGMESARRLFFHSLLVMCERMSKESAEEVKKDESVRDRNQRSEKKKRQKQTKQKEGSGPSLPATHVYVLYAVYLQTVNV